jgi:hypothetical protein
MDALKQANTVLRKLGVATTTMEVLHYHDLHSGCTGCDVAWLNHCIFCKLPIDEQLLDEGYRPAYPTGTDDRYPGWPVHDDRAHEIAFGRMCFHCFALGPDERGQVGTNGGVGRTGLDVWMASVDVAKRHWGL